MTYSLIFIVPCFFAIAFSNIVYARVNTRKISSQRAQLEQAFDFKVFYKILKILVPASLILALTPLRGSALFFDLPNEIRILGILALFFSQFLFAKSIKALGNQYSPCFNSKISTEIVVEGPYKNIRHPIYTANILTLASITLLSQSYIIFVLEMIFIYFCLRSAKREEKILSLNLVSYKKYMASTGMFIPKILF